MGRDGSAGAAAAMGLKQQALADFSDLFLRFFNYDIEV